MALYLCKNPDGTGLITENNPIQTKHTNQGEPVTLPLYIYNDGKRKGVPNDSVQPLIYTDLQIKIEGVATTLQQALTVSITDVTLNLESIDGYNIGTILKSGTERMRVEEITGAKSLRVQRNYTSDNGASTIQAHEVGAIFISESSSVSLALPSVSDYDSPAVFLGGGISLKGGLDPSYLSNALDNQEASNTVRVNKSNLYSANSLIKIDDEIMKVVSVSGLNELKVLRGYNGIRTSHNANALVTCVGIVDIAPITHKFFLKNDPPAGLPTQKKRDVIISIVADEEPL